MIHTGYELLWLFFVYSFGGWVFETIIAACKHKRFTNRGVVNLPLCILYGTAAVFITIFGSELQGVWLYLGSVIIIMVFKWAAGHFIEKIYHEQWWDYSKSRWNIDRYVSLPNSLILGFAAVAMIKWGNPALVKVFWLLPKMAGKVVIWVLLAFILADIIATWMILLQKDHSAKWKKVDNWFSDISNLLSKKIYNNIACRIEKAYPNAKRVEQEKNPAIFAYGCSFHKLVWLFIISSFLGDITETIFCRITAGVWMSRSSVVWGPFSIVWGLAIVFATMLLHKYKDRSDKFIFLTGTVLGGAYEYVCSVFTELVFGKIFWDYSKIPFNLGGRINLLYCFFWGIAAVVWIKGIYPKVSAWIEKVPVRIGKVISWIFVVFMCCNMVVSGMALMRSTQRAQGIPAEQNWQKIMDERFDDDRLEKIYPNAINTN